MGEDIPCQSVDLIFTDPIYSEKWMYSWLADFAQRVLKPGKAVLVWSNGKWHRENTNWLEEAGLKYRYDFTSIHHAGGSPMNGKIISKTNRVIWLDNDGESKLNGYVPDGHLSKPWHGPKEFKWTKNPRLTNLLICAFSDVGGIVIDPFCGGGTIPSMCKQTNRKYIAFEIEPERVALSQRRLETTQIMLVGQEMGRRTLNEADGLRPEQSGEIYQSQLWANDGSS